MPDTVTTPPPQGVSSIYGLVRQPCFHSAVLPAIPIGLTLGLAKFGKGLADRRSNAVAAQVPMRLFAFRCSSVAVYSFLIIASVTWPICRWQETKKRERIGRAMDAQMEGWVRQEEEVRKQAQAELQAEGERAKRTSTPSEADAS